MAGTQDTADKRATLLDIAQGGIGQGDGIIYEDADAPAAGRFYFYWEATKGHRLKYCFSDREQAARILDLVSGRNALEATRNLLEI